jgi:hypothetical protein
MRKLNISLVLLLVVLCVVLISAVNAQRPEQHFEYAKVEMTDGVGAMLFLKTEKDSYMFAGKDFAGLLTQLSGESEQIGRIKMIDNELGMFNFLGDYGWELVSAYCYLGDEFPIQKEKKQFNVTGYIFKRLID